MKAAIVLILFVGICHGQFAQEVTYATAGSSPGSVLNSQGVAYDPFTDRLLVADTDNHRISIFDAETGSSELPFGGQGTGLNQFQDLKGITVDSNGLVHVADTGNNRVMSCDLVGDCVELVTGFTSPLGIAFRSNGNFLVSSESGNIVNEYTSAGVFVDTFGSMGSGDGQFDVAGGIAIEPVTDYAYVCDTGGGRVHIFDETNTFVSSIGVQFPRFIDISVNGLRYVTTLTGLNVYPPASTNVRSSQSFQGSGVAVIRPHGLVAMSRTGVSGVLGFATALSGQSCGVDNECVTSVCSNGVCTLTRCGTCEEGVPSALCQIVTNGTDPNGDCGSCEACYSGSCSFICETCEICESNLCVFAEDWTDPNDDCSLCQGCVSGACQNVAEQEDPNDECGGCEVCDGNGACEPAEENTDPKGDCPICTICNGVAGQCVERGCLSSASTLHNFLQ